MMLHGQLGQSQTVPAFFDAGTPQIRVLGMLANEAIQLPSLRADSGTVAATLYDAGESAYPTVKLRMLKKLKFTSQGKDKRIAASLEAINTLSPTTLTAVQWIELVEEVDDED